MARPSTFASVFFLLLLGSLGVAAVWAFARLEAQPALFEVTARFQRMSDLEGVPEPASKRDLIRRIYAEILALRTYYFKGRPAIEQLIRDLSLTKDIPHTADGALTPEGLATYNALIESISTNVIIRAEVETDNLELVTVKVRHENADMAARIANKLVENYMTNVRSRMDDTLLDQKKFYDQEVNRYRRKVSELESARLRFGMQIQMDGMDVDIDDPVSVYRALQSPASMQNHANALKRLNRLRELTKDKPVGDVVILELLRLEEIVAEAEAQKERYEENKVKLEMLNRNFFQIRNDRLKFVRELKESTDQLAHWSERLAATQMALTLNVGERGLRLSFVERASDAKAVNR